MKPIHLLTLPLILGGAHAAEPSAPARTAAYQGGISQEQLRVTSQRLKDEISRLADAYARYPAAAADVALLRKTVAEMDRLSSNDMATVAKSLMDASRSMDAKIVQGSLNEANGSQKGIQIALQAMADKLARQSDLAAMQKRLGALAIRQHANLEATRYLAGTAPTLQKMPAHLRDNHRARKEEQAALGKETNLALQALEKLSAEIGPDGAKFLQQAATTARDRKLTEQADDAITDIELDLTEAVSSQGGVLDSLKAMIANLDAGKTADQRTRELASELDDMARKQEELANLTPKMNGSEQEAAAKKQEEIAARLDAMEDRLAMEDPQAAAQTQQAALESSQAANELADDRLRREPNRVEKTAEQQNKVADGLTELAGSLQKKADAMAGTTPDQAPLDPEQAAMQEAMNTMQDAKSDLEIAQLQNSGGQDASAKTNSAMEKMNQAGEQLKQAGQGQSDTGRNLQAAEGHTQQAAGGQNVKQNLTQGAEKLAGAMSSLQASMNQSMQAKAAQDSAGAGMGAGDNSSNKTRTDARGKAADSQREALSLRQQDKVAPAYETAVNQYLKNLAEDDGSSP
ncbi:MAG: hypothetical protein V4689_10000 [Verrucomicrobiota bacterium]